MSNLALRVLTAVVALPLVGALVAWREPLGFGVLVLGVAAPTRLCGRRRRRARGGALSAARALARLGARGPRRGVDGRAARARRSPGRGCAARAGRLRRHLSRRPADVARAAASRRRAR